MIDMTQGSPVKLITKFTVPLLLGNLLQQMYNVVDSIVVGNFVGSAALAAVGNSFIVMFLLFALFGGLGMGATILISQFLGANQKDKLKAVIDTMYIALLVGGTLVGIIGIFSARFFLELLNTPEGPVMEMSIVYLRTVFIGSAATFGYSINSGILHGVGDGKSPLLFLAISTVLNIILDLVFVAGFGMGVFGVALATIIAQGFSFLFGIRYINKKITLFSISFRKMHFSAEILRQSFKIGFPAAIQNMMMSVGTMVLQRLVNSYGADFMAGYSAAAKIDSFVFMPIMSFSTAVTTYVGQNIGAQNLQRVKQGLRAALGISVGLSIFISISVILFGRYLLMAFTQDESVILVGQAYINRIMPGFFLLAIIFMVNSTIRGAGQTVFPLIVTVVSFLGIRVPLAYVYAHFFGEYNMFWCFGSGWLIGICMVVPYYLSGHWKKKAFQFVTDTQTQVKET